MYIKHLVFILFSCSLLVISACEATKNAVNNLNVFPVSDDIKLGLQVSKEINANSKEFPILPEASNRELYQYTRKIRDKILNSGQIRYKTQFKWDLKIIDDSKTLNAFVTPGGHIYLYTGLIKFLDSEDQLAGVLGHEIAHADRRHSTRQMTKSGAMTLLSDAVLGKGSAVDQVVDALVGLKFSRSHEAEADEYSVKYLCATNYNAAGCAGFFEKIQKQGGTPPQFLSTHPNPDNRVVNIKGKAKVMNCSGKERYTSEYTRIKGLIR